MSMNTITDTYLAAVSQGRADSAGYIKDNLKIDKAFGYVKPYVPVVRQADVRLVWIPTHKSKDDTGTLVARPLGIYHGKRGRMVY